MSHVDLHLHLLPGVDDGPDDEAAALQHAERMHRRDVHEATVTPHVGHPCFDVDVATIAERTRILQTALDRERLRVRLRPGGEIHASAASRLSARELDLVAQGPPGRRWVLLEVPFAGIDTAYLDGLARVCSLGFGVVVAHPERAAGLLRGGLAALRDDLVRGAVLQVNVCSLLGVHGDEARTAGRRLVRSGLAYLLASDGDGGTRAHTLADGTAAARAAGASIVRAWRLTTANPALLLRDGLAADTAPDRVPAPAHGRAAVAR